MIGDLPPLDSGLLPLELCPKELYRTGRLKKGSTETWILAFSTKGIERMRENQEDLEGV